MLGAWLCGPWSTTYLVEEETTLAEFADNPNTKNNSNDEEWTD